MPHKKWKRLQPGQSVPVARADLRKAQKIAWYWQKRAKRPRNIRIVRADSGWQAVRFLSP